MSEYVENALKFMQKNGVKMSIKYVDYVYNPWNEEKWARWHNKYKVIIKRNNTVNFYDSAYNTENGLKPTEYDILACLQKYDVGSFEDFCWEFGYDLGTKNVEKTYKAVVREYNNVVRVFGDIIKELEEIQ